MATPMGMSYCAIVTSSTRDRCHTLLCNCNVITSLINYFMALTTLTHCFYSSHPLFTQLSQFSRHSRIVFITLTRPTDLPILITTLKVFTFCFSTNTFFFPILLDFQRSQDLFSKIPRILPYIYRIFFIDMTRLKLFQILQFCNFPNHPEVV